jgi:hypothetical protein
MSGFGNSWFGNSWFGNSWMGNSWGGVGGAGGGAFAMDEVHPLTVVDGTLNTDVSKFPIGYWNADLLSQVGVIQFFKLDWEQEIDSRVDSFQPDNLARILDPNHVRIEIEKLKAHISSKERTAARDEILQQDQNFQLYWLHMLMMSRSSHPKTFFLLKIAARVGELVMIHYKNKFQRPRPSQICPALMPLLEVPGHASFPSGHSLLSHLTSLCLIDLAPRAKDSLTELANRVARNRELAGVHYESDSTAGAEVAEVVHDLLPQCEIFAQTYAKAEQEWADSNWSLPSVDIQTSAA